MRRKVALLGLLAFSLTPNVTACYPLHCQETELGLCVVDDTGEVEFADVDAVALEAQAEVGGDPEGISAYFTRDYLASNEGAALGIAFCGLRSVCVRVEPGQSLESTALKHELKHVLIGGLCDPDHEVVR